MTEEGGLATPAKKYVKDMIVRAFEIGVILLGCVIFQEGLNVSVPSGPLVMTFGFVTAFVGAAAFFNVKMHW